MTALGFLKVIGEQGRITLSIDRTAMNAILGARGDFESSLQSWAYSWIQTHDVSNGHLYGSPPAGYGKDVSTIATQVGSFWANADMDHPFFFNLTFFPEAIRIQTNEDVWPSMAVKYRPQFETDIAAQISGWLASH